MSISVECRVVRPTRKIGDTAFSEGERAHEGSFCLVKVMNTCRNRSISLQCMFETRGKVLLNGMMNHRLFFPILVPSLRPDLSRITRVRSLLRRAPLFKVL